MSGAKSRRKGADAEREFCRMVRQNLGIECARNLAQYQQSDGDILLLDFLVEVKCQARLNTQEWWRQAVAQAKRRGMIPALAYKVARKGWHVVLPLPDAWKTGCIWRESLDYSMTLRPEGFFLVCREYMP